MTAPQTDLRTTLAIILARARHDPGVSHEQLADQVLDTVKQARPAKAAKAPKGE